MKPSKTKTTILPFIVLIITVISVWLYWHGDSKLQQQLVSREWQSNTVAHMNMWEQKVAAVDKVSIHSTVKYLPNNTYLKNSTLTFTGDKLATPVEIIISESGNWVLSDNYLVVTPGLFKDVSTKPLVDLTSEEVEELKALFKIASQQSRRIDIINDKTMMLTGLDNASKLLFSQ